MSVIHKRTKSFLVDPQTQSHDWWGRHYSLWEDETFEIFDLFLRKDKNFIDIGAWIGTTCLYASLSSKHVYSIEADPISIQDIKKNIKINNFTNITLCERPIYNSNKEMYFGPQSGSWNLSTSKLKWIKDSELDVTLRTITLNEFIKEYDIKDISLIKVDIEGGEEDIIHDLFSLGIRSPIYLSFHSCWWKDGNVGRFNPYWTIYKYIYYKLKLVNPNEIQKILATDPFASFLFTNVEKDKAKENTKSDVPIFIPLYNNLTYAKNMINQLIPYNHNITLIDNKSDYPPLLEYYNTCKELGIRVIRLEQNMGPQQALMNRFNDLPNIFIYTDPDLLLHKDIPSNFIQIMVDLTEKYKVYKVGFALNIQNHKEFTDKTFRGQSIHTWESQWWTQRINDDKFELYRADIDTTFAVYNKKYYRGDFYSPAIRIAGNFTCEHVPWYRNPVLKLNEEEEKHYKKGNRFSAWT